MHINVSLLVVIIVIVRKMDNYLTKLYMIIYTHLYIALELSKLYSHFSDPNTNTLYTRTRDHCDDYTFWTAEWKKPINLNAQVFQILVRMITILKIVFVINKVSSKLFFL